MDHSRWDICCLMHRMTLVIWVCRPFNWSNCFQIFFSCPYSLLNKFLTWDYKTQPRIANQWMLSPNLSFDILLGVWVSWKAQQRCSTGMQQRKGGLNCVLDGTQMDYPCSTSPSFQTRKRNKVIQMIIVLLFPRCKMADAAGSFITAVLLSSQVTALY